MIREVTYHLMELDKAGQAFSRHIRQNFGDGSRGLGLRCDEGKPSWEPSVPYGSFACYRDDAGRANLRIVDGVTTGCTQLQAAGKWLKKPAIHITVQGEDGDIARLFKAGYGDRLWHMFEQAGAPPSDMCPH